MHAAHSAAGRVVEPEVGLEDDAATGCALIHVRPDGENAITVLPGANGRVTGPAEGAPADVFAGARALVLQMEIPPEANRAWAAAARARQVPVLLNAAPAGADAAALLSLVDALLVNEGELAELCRLTGRTAATLGPPTLVTTLGERGCRAWHRGRALRSRGRAGSRGRETRWRGRGR